MKIHEIIRRKRKERGMTQEELAAYLGVSASAVNKWERGISFPDITFLPILASYFNISVDELLGYEPQMTREQIQELYHSMSGRFAIEPFDKIYRECEEYIRKYRSCYPLLLQMAGLYLNYAEYAADKLEILNRAVVLAECVEKESEEINVAKEARQLRMTCFLMLGQPDKVLEISGDAVRPIEQEPEAVGQAVFMKGEADRAMEIFQVCAYQHLLSFVGDTAFMIGAQAEESPQAEKMVERGLELFRIYHLEELHFNAAAQFYLSAAGYYARCGRKEEALNILEKYAACCIRLKFPVVLHGDEYFDRVERWLDRLALGRQAPRSEKAIKAALTDALVHNPAFEPLAGEKRFLRIIENLKTHFEVQEGRGEEE